MMGTFVFSQTFYYYLYTKKIDMEDGEMIEK